RTPRRSATALSGAPAFASGKRMSQAATDATPSARKPAASACPASPNPMNASEGCDIADLLEAVQPCRIFHQDLALQLGLRSHEPEQRHEVAVVRHVFADV